MRYRYPHRRPREAPAVGTGGTDMRVEGNVLVGEAAPPLPHIPGVTSAPAPAFDATLLRTTPDPLDPERD